MELKKELIPLARHVVGVAAETLSETGVRRLLKSLGEIQKNLSAAINAPAASPRRSAGE
jgi:hypothetical protein